MKNNEGGEEMNYVNYIFRGNCIKFFPETGWVSESSIVSDGVKNA